MTRFCSGAMLAGLAATMSLAVAAAPEAEPAGWSGNLAKNPGFEEDFVNLNSESHVLSFKGDWYYNQQDFVPDYWDLAGDWTWSDREASEGRHSLKLAADAKASQTFVRAVWQSGGGAWGGVQNTPIPVAAAEQARFAQPWRVTAQVRGGGKIIVNGITNTAPAGAGWQLVTVDVPADKLAKPEDPVVIDLAGPGEFDAVVVQEQLPAAPNLLANPGFEQTDKTGYPVGWAREQKKFLAIGPTYYVWTDWNHVFRPNRGPVGTDPLVAHGGNNSLRFDVYPGDEKYIESDLITLNQDQPRVIEVGAYVQADRINLIDIRCVDQEGDYLPGYRPRQPEYAKGGSFLYGNGTFGWRYVRKFFSVPNNVPVKGIRVRLCARGFNGHTLDDAGTRSYCLQVGTVWWDDIRVTERTSDAAALQVRRVKIPPTPAAATPAVGDGAIDPGERAYGDNTFSYRFVNNGGAASFQLKLTTTLPGAAPVTTTSKSVPVAKGARGNLAAEYRLAALAGELAKQGTFQVELLKGKTRVAEATYAFNTWPVVADIDVSRHYNLPTENPVTVSINLGVADQTLAQTKKLELQLVETASNKLLGTTTVTDLVKAFADTRATLPKKQDESYEFNLPTPAWWVDRHNLIITKVELAPLKVWPHDNPVRDTVLLVRGLDASGQELFRQRSESFCRMNPPPRQPAIQEVKVREDGAVLVNGEPRYLMGATHQNQRTTHGFPIIAQLGLMGHRLTQGADAKYENLQKLWSDHGLYGIQVKPVSGQGGTEVVTEMTPEQRQALTAFVAAGGMQNVVSINTGGWEAMPDFDNPAQIQKHQELNDWIRQTTKRPVAISTSGAYNAWWLEKLTLYDINHAETEMWGPMDFNVIYTPYMKRAGRTTAWVYLPQLYDNTPYERYRFETYENIIRGSAGVSMIQGIGDPTFNRGLAGELRGVEKPLNSQEPAPAVTFEPNVSHKVTSYQKKTYILATNCGPLFLGQWQWDATTKQSGQASHEGDSVNTFWVRPGGIRIHGFRGMPLPELIQKGDKIVQYVWLDPQATPDWVMVAVRGDGRFAHNAVLGTFNFDAFKKDLGHIRMYSELEHSVWHEINYVCDDEVYRRGVKLLGQPWADDLRKSAADGIKKVEKMAYQAEHFHALGALPQAGAWHRIELAAEQVGLVGTLVDGFAWLTKNGRALWDYSALERDGKIVRVFCEDSIGIDRALLTNVKVNVPGLKAGAKINVLFEGRTITAAAGAFTDNFDGVDTYGSESGGVQGDLLGFVKDEDRVLPRLMPSGTGYDYGPTAVHIYEVDQ